MQKSLIRPIEVTIVASVSARADLGPLSRGLWAHAYVLKNNLRLNCFVGTTLTDVYANCGCLNTAYHLFDEMHHQNTFCYNAMIREFAIHGQGHEALDLFRKMRIEGFAPDEITVLGVICACSYVGLVDEGCKCFESMADYGLEPKLEHYGSWLIL